jgi:transcriptional regulator with XRE-family HTH domain
MLFDNKIRQLREKKQMLQRQFVAALKIDIPMYSKIKHDEYRAKHEQVIKPAAYFNINEDELLIAWFSDKVVYEVLDEDIALQVLKVAAEKVKYNKTQKI